MRKLIAIGAVIATVLTVSGVALAHLQASGFAQTTATFKVSEDQLSTRTCTGGGDTYSIGRGRYTGTIDFADAQNDLDGPFSLNVTWVYNTSKKNGTFEGSWRVKDTGDQDSKRARGYVTGVLGAGSNGAIAVDGFASGRVNGSYALLTGGLSANLLPNGSGEITSIEGKIGNADNHFPAELVGRPCSGDEKPRPDVKLVVHGTVSTLDTTNHVIGVKPGDNSAEQKCTLKDGVSPSTDKVQVGDKVEIACGLVGGENVLLRLHDKGHH